MFPVIKTISYFRKYNTKIIQNAIKNKNKKNYKKLIKRSFSCKEYNMSNQAMTYNEHMSSCEIPPNSNNNEPPNPNNDDNNFWIYYMLGISFYISVNSMIKKQKI
jgi:hypothetical protein